MKTIAVFVIFQIANLTMIRECYASIEKISSSRMLDDPSAPLCSKEFDEFYQLNIVFQHGFKGDESCNITGSDPDSVQAHCNYDKASASTAAECDSLNGVLYEVDADEHCDHLQGVIFDAEYENAYLCIGKSCDVDEVLEMYKSEIESDGTCSVTFYQKKSDPENLTTVVPICSEEFDNFYELNVVFQQAFKIDNSCEVTDSDQGPHVLEAHCNYDKASASTVADCDSLNGVLYEVGAEEHCGTPPDINFYAEYENAYLCIGKSCGVDEVLDMYKSEMESDRACSLTFSSEKSDPENPPTVERIPTKYGACEDIDTGRTTCVLTSNDCEPMELWLPVVEGCSCSDVQIGLCTGNTFAQPDYCAISSEECDNSMFVPAKTVKSTHSSDCRLCYEDESLPSHSNPSTSTSSSSEDETSSPEPSSSDTSSSPRLSTSTSSTEDDGANPHLYVIVFALVGLLAITVVIVIWKRSKLKDYVLHKLRDDYNDKCKNEENEEQMQDVCIT